MCWVEVEAGSGDLLIPHKVGSFISELFLNGSAEQGSAPKTWILLPGLT